MYVHRVVDVEIFHRFKFYRKPVSTDGIQIECYGYCGVRWINCFFFLNEIRKQVNIVFSVFLLFGTYFPVNGRLQSFCDRC